MERLIFHIDVNSAFLSWESVRRTAAGEPDLRLVPSIIGGDPGRRTSIVLAKSVPAKKYGIVTGEPVSAALRKCPELQIAPSDFALYSEMSHVFRAVCRDYTPVVEVFSIDECFLDMTGTGRMYPDPVKLAHEIKDRIRSELGFTVNVGIGPNKLLAKMASDFEKPDKVHTLFEYEIASKRWPLPMGELFLCGRQSAEKLSRLHIDTIGALANTDAKTIQAIVGNKMGEQLWRFANGIDDSPVSGEHEAPKGYSNEITFDDNITDWQTGNNVLLHLADNVAARVRRDRVKAFCISVTIRGNDMKKHSHQRKLAAPTDGTTKVYEAAKELFAELWDGRTALRLIGLAMTELDNDSEQQISMFDTAALDSSAHGSSALGSLAGESEKDKSADKAVDILREKYGNDIIKRGGMINSNVKVRKR